MFGYTMNKKQLRRILYFTTPLLLFFIPYKYGFDLGKYFQTIIIQPKKTGITTFHYYDQKRARPIVTEIWYPIDPDMPAQASAGFWLRCDEARDAPLSDKKLKYPLIVMSHGSGGDRFNISWLAEVLAANGYIVAAMDHYGNTWNNKIPEYYLRPWERPLDVSFVLDQVLTSSHFKDHIDQDKIGFAGYSLGGATGIWIAGAEIAQLDSAQFQENCIRDLGDVVPLETIQRTDFSPAIGSYLDKRISAMFVMAPALGWLFEEHSLKRIEIPIFIVASEDDHVVPIENNAKIFAKRLAHAFLKIIPGEASHYVFLNQATVVGKRFLEPKYCIDAASIDRKKIHVEISRNSVLFFDEHLYRK